MTKGKREKFKRIGAVLSLREERARKRGIFQGVAMVLLIQLAICFLALVLIPASACEALWGLVCR